MGDPVNANPVLRNAPLDESSLPTDSTPFNEYLRPQSGLNSAPATANPTATSTSSQTSTNAAAAVQATAQQGSVLKGALKFLGGLVLRGLGNLLCLCCLPAHFTPKTIATTILTPATWLMGAGRYYMSQGDAQFTAGREGRAMAPTGGLFQLPSWNQCMWQARRAEYLVSSDSSATPSPARLEQPAIDQQRAQQAS